MATAAFAGARLRLKASGGARKFSVFIQADFQNGVTRIHLTVRDRTGSIVWDAYLTRNEKVAEEVFEGGIKDVEGWSIKCDSYGN